MSAITALARSLALGLAGLTLTLLAAAQDVASTATQCPPRAQPPSAEQLSQARAQARDRGPLWRISKDGRVSWLFGTLHIGRMQWLAPGPRLRAALQSSDVLALELDIADPATQRALQAGYASPGPTLDAELSLRLRQQLGAACLPAEAFARMHPVLQTVTLATLAGRWDGLDPNYGQELLLGELARASQLPVAALETPEQQLALLLPQDEASGLAMTRQMLEQLEQGKVRPVLKRLAAAWERGDLDELARYEQWCDCAPSAAERAYLARLNDGRNPGLAERIDALHGQGKRVFAAVGALHMTGPQALPELLRAKGYQVERIKP